jgi:hypothetical protein
MKTELITSALLLGLASIGTLSAADSLPPRTPAEGQFAVLKPLSACGISVPSGRSSSQVYYSKDCQTAYILPSLNMKKTILDPYFTADTGICARYEQVVNSLSNIDEEVKQLQSYITKLNQDYSNTDDPAVLKVISDKMSYFKKEQDFLKNQQEIALNPFYETAALRTQIRIESDIMDEVAAFQAANLTNVINGIKIFPTSIAPAQLNNGLLVISQKGVDANKGHSVLNIDFPGTLYIPAEAERSFYKNSASLINMNGSMSGIVDLSAVTFCSALKKQNLNLDNGIDTEKLKNIFNSAVALNYDYQVRVEVGTKVHMKSTLDVRDFLSRIQSKVVNTAFTRDELFGTMTEGGVLNNLVIELDGKGGEQVDLAKKVLSSNEAENKDDSYTMIASLISKFTNAHLERLEAKLEKLGVLKVVDEAHARDVKARTTLDKTGYKSICNTSSSWFGFSRSTTCHNEPVYEEISHDGISTLLSTNVDNENITDEVTFETNTVTNVRHTSTFGRK